mgnify:CR=1 FL=1
MWVVRAGQCGHPHHLNTTTNGEGEILEPLVPSILANLDHRCCMFFGFTILCHFVPELDTQGWAGRSRAVCACMCSRRHACLRINAFSLRLGNMRLGDRIAWQGGAVLAIHALCKLLRGELLVHSRFCDHLYAHVALAPMDMLLLHLQAQLRGPQCSAGCTLLLLTGMPPRGCYCFAGTAMCAAMQCWPSTPCASCSRRTCWDIPV